MIIMRADNKRGRNKKKSENERRLDRHIEEHEAIYNYTQTYMMDMENRSRNVFFLCIINHLYWIKCIYSEIEKKINSYS